MPIDASIYADFRPRDVPLNTPTQTAAQLGVFNEIAQHIQDQKQAALDQTAMQQAVAQTGGDYEKAIASLNAAGRVSAAQALQGAWDKRQEAAGKALEAHLKAQDAQLGYYSHLANLISDDASQKSVLATLSPEDAQRVAPLLGDTYDPERVGRIRDVLLDGQKRAQMQHEALQDWLASGKSTQDGVTTLAKYLSATPQAQWGQIISGAKSLGIPKASVDFVTQNVTTPEQADALANKKEGDDKSVPIVRLGRDGKTVEQWTGTGWAPAPADIPKGAHFYTPPAPTVIKTGGAPGTAGGLTTGEGGGVEYAGTLTRIMGRVPVGLARSGGAATAAINEAARQTKVLGRTPIDSVLKTAVFQGDQKALANVQRLRTAADAFENKALAQLDIVDGLSDKVGRTKFPILNSAILAGKTQILGDPDATLLLNAIQTASTEYAKIVMGGTASAQALSDTAAKEAKKLLNEAMNKGTLKRATALMRTEMDLTMKGFDASEKHIMDNMGAAGGAPQSSAPTPQPPLGPYDVQAPNGKVYHFTSQAQSDAFKKAAGIP